MKRTLATVLVAAVAAGVPGYAHHSFAAEYNESQTVTVEGDLVEFEFRSPHAWVRVMAKDGNGEMQQFGAEWFSAQRLRQQEITAETLKPGDHVIIVGNPGRNPDDHRLRMVRLKRTSDGWTWGGRPGETFD